MAKQQSDGYADLRRRLLKRKAELLGRVERLHVDLTHESEAVEKDFAEQATQREHEDVLAALDVSAKIELARIERALARMAKGTYGRCAVCGEDIDPARLDALPDSERCTACAA